MKKNFFTLLFLVALLPLKLFSVTTDSYNIELDFPVTATTNYTTNQIVRDLTFVKGGSNNIQILRASQPRSTSGKAYSFSGIRNFLTLLGGTSRAYVEVEIGRAHV